MSTREYCGKGLEALEETHEHYKGVGYELFTPNERGVDWYLPHEGTEPHNCAMVAIWMDANGLVWSDEY